jgi:hypothetical protein
MIDDDGASAEAAVSVAKFKRSHVTSLLLEHSGTRGVGGFTLGELMVTVGVLVLLVLLFTQLLNSAPPSLALVRNRWMRIRARDSSLIKWPSISRR